MLLQFSPFSLLQQRFSFLLVSLVKFKSTNVFLPNNIADEVIHMLLKGTKLDLQVLCFHWFLAFSYTLLQRWLFI